MSDSDSYLRPGEKSTHQTRKFSFLPYSHKILLSALLGPFTDRTAFPVLLYTTTSEIPTLLDLSLQKVPLSGGAFTYRPLKGVPSPPLQDSYVSEKQPLQCHGSTYDLLKIRKKWIGPRTFSLHFSYQTRLQQFRLLSTCKEVLNEIINRRTHSKEANIF